MTVIKKQSRLKKQLRLIDVYAMATGATLSSGFFLQPDPRAPPALPPDISPAICGPSCG